LDDIEVQQRADMIRDISEITDTLYKNNQQQNVGQKELLKMIVGSILKNN